MSYTSRTNPVSPSMPPLALRTPSGSRLDLSKPWQRVARTTTCRDEIHEATRRYNHFGAEVFERFREELGAGPNTYERLRHNSIRRRLT
ncbi:hypothetical protein OSTOST_21639, partial [Ostertagia ostertagi]